MVIVFYISGHGFGHAARSTQVIDALARRLPDRRVVVRTTVPRWFLDASLDTAVDIVPGDVDTGVVQQDGLSIDETETARRAAAFYGDFDTHVAREAEVLRSIGTTLVVADIPPLAFAAAAKVGVPSIALSNFTWDWIYQGFPRFDAEAPDTLDTIASAYATATLALRLPFAGGFASMPRVADVPLIGRRAVVPRADVRARLGISDGRPVVIASFGGHGRTASLERAVAPDQFTLVATDYETSDRRDIAGLRVVPADRLRTAGVSYTDLLASCDAVVTKLGYGVVSDCIANRVALLHVPRDRFVEEDVFVRDLPRVLRTRSLSRGDFAAGRWGAAIDALLAQPAPPEEMRVDGASVAAGIILDACCSGGGA